MTQTPDYKNLAENMMAIADAISSPAFSLPTSDAIFRQSAIALRKAGEMEAALRPFARIGENFVASVPDDAMSGFDLTVRDFRAAAAALKDTRA